MTQGTSRVSRPQGLTTCPSCGRLARTKSRGLCGRCYASPARHGYEPRRRQGNPLTPGELARAKGLEGLFVTHFLPAVRKKACWRFRLLAWQERQECVSECVARAWEHWARLVGRRRVEDPLRYVASVAKWSVASVRGWTLSTGAVSRDDVLSRRREVEGGVRAVRGDAPSRFDGLTLWERVGRRDDDRTYLEWVGSLPCRERAFVWLVMEGNDVLEARDAMGLETREMTELVDALWDSWEAYAHRP